MKNQTINTHPPENSGEETSYIDHIRLLDQSRPWPVRCTYHRTTFTPTALRLFYERSGRYPHINTAQELYYLSHYEAEIKSIEAELRTLQMTEGLNRRITMIHGDYVSRDLRGPLRLEGCNLPPAGGDTREKGGSHV